MAESSEREPIPLRIKILRACNPLIAGLLRSRAHRLLSGDLLLITVTGRKTGRAYITPLSYIIQDGAPFCFTRPTVASWWKNLRGGAAVEIVYRGQQVKATAQIVDASSEQALDALRIFLTRNPGTASLYNVSLDGERKPIEGDLSREVLRSIVVKLDIGGA